MTIISTHALREEGDPFDYESIRAIVEFLPTPSARRATYKTSRPDTDNLISTHALREEGDL